MTDQPRSCKTESAPPSGLGEGGQVTEEMVRAFIDHLDYRALPSWSELKEALAVAMPHSPLSRRVEELEAEREQLRKIADSVLLARLASSYHVMNAALDRLADHLHPEIAEARALLKDGER